MKNIEPVGEFGSYEWGMACVAAGKELLEVANLEPDLAWGFSEIYTFPPARLLEGGRALSGYYMMVKEGQISGGDGVIDECLELPGFHVKIPWAAICNQSASLYGREGQRQRSADEKVMYEAIAEYVGRPNPLNMEPRREAYWPSSVGAALGAGSEEGGGLHNMAASLQAPSPEFADLPTTELGVPNFAAMTKEQKEFFLDLLHVER